MLGGEIDMSILGELEAALQHYLDGGWTLADLRRWRRSHAQALADSSDPAVAALYGTLAHALAEHLSGDRTEPRVREALAAELAHTMPDGQSRSAPLVSTPAESS